MSKFEPSNGDTGVVGVVNILARNALSSVGFFFTAVTANGYASVAQNLYDANLRLSCKGFPDEINDGDYVTADIASENGVLIAVNISKL